VVAVSMVESDERWMRLALQLATKGRGFTNPNPMVGAVIVGKDNYPVGGLVLTSVNTDLPSDPPRTEERTGLWISSLSRLFTTVVPSSGVYCRRYDGVSVVYTEYGFVGAKSTMIVCGSKMVQSIHQC